MSIDGMSKLSGIQVLVWEPWNDLVEADGSNTGGTDVHAFDIAFRDTVEDSPTSIKASYHRVRAPKPLANHNPNAKDRFGSIGIATRTANVTVRSTTNTACRSSLRSARGW
jgi:hypothetical protein